jgi:hypothetical protein
MYSSVDSGSEKQLSGLKRLARRDLPTTPRTPRPSPQPASVHRESIDETPAAWPALTLVSSMIWVRERLFWVGLLAAAGLFAGYLFVELRPEQPAPRCREQAARPDVGQCADACRH